MLVPSHPFARAVSAIVLAASLASQAALVTSANARPLTPAEQRYARWGTLLPACENPDVASTLKARFSEREGFWDSNIYINDLQNIRETGFRSSGVDYIPRRFCVATAMMSDNKEREVSYAIGADLGMTGTDAIGSAIQSLTFGIITSSTGTSSMGWNWGLDWCVSGLDRNNAYGRNCAAVKR